MSLYLVKKKSSKLNLIPSWNIFHDARHYEHYQISRSNSFPCSHPHTPSVNIWEPWTIMLTGITKRNISMVSFELFLQWCSCMAVLILWGSCKLRHSPPPPHLHTRKKIVYVCKHETICTNTAREAGGCRSSKKELTLSVSHKLVCETRLGSVWHDL